MQLVDIGGRRLAMWCSGTGRPAVVLETGLGAPASDWTRVHQGVAPLTSVCHYDRANCGSSDATETPRSALDMAQDLHALIGRSSLRTPVIMVGHSFGGPIIVNYAHAWPDDVAALVLVDPTHPEQFTTFGPIMPDAFGPMKEFWQTGWRSTESTPEHIDFLRTFEELRAIADLGNLKLLILTSSAWRGLGDDDDAQETWVRLHQDYMRLSSDSRQRVLPKTDHFLQRCAPEAIVEAIREVLGELRK